MDERLWKKYWLRAVWGAWLLRFVPFVRMVGLNGSMVTGNLNSKSDIDFLIITERGHLYTANILSIITMRLFGLKVHGNKIIGRICLNRYQVVNNLKIGEESVYHARVFHNLIPLFASKELYKKYCKYNRWMGQFGYPLVENSIVWEVSIFSYIIQALGELILLPFTRILEKKLKDRQKGIYKRDVKAKHPQSVVILSDCELRCHLPKGIID